MPGMEPLGRLFNILPVADDTYVSLQNAGAVTFVGVNAAGETWTLTEAKTAAGGSAAVLPTISRYYVSATNGAVWQELTQTAGSAITTTASQDVLCVTVTGAELSDTFTHLKLASTGAGTVFAILHELSNQRAPQLLPALV